MEVERWRDGGRIGRVEGVVGGGEGSGVQGGQDMG